MELADVPRHRPLAFDKMESLIKAMQDPETGVPVRSQKLFLTYIPSAFMGYDLVEWLMDRFNLDETSNVEAINLANQLCQYGYFFPVNDSKTLVLKDDSSLYRFQSPYYWPWQPPRVGGSAPIAGPDNVEYAIYLVKRTLRNKQRHGLEDHEVEALANLKKNLAAKWDFITMQAEEQVRIAKDRKKGDKIVSDSQERAYWRVARPPPGTPNVQEPCPVPVRSRVPKPKKRTIQQLTREIEHLKASLDRTRVKTSIALEALLAYSETFTPYDPWLTPPQPSNPWISDDTLFWQINSPLVEVPSEKRVQRWALSIEELVSDPTGLQEFTSFLRKEYSHENIRFWTAVMDLRRSGTKQIPKKLDEIYEEFLKPGAPCEINIDGATAEKVAEGLRSGSRFALDHAADHVYSLLLKKDCYPRFIRSDHFQRLLAEGKNVHQKKAKFFNFGGGGQVKKKPGCAGSAGSGGLSRRRGSDRSLSGSAHELAVSAAHAPPPRLPDPPPHSHSQSNLADIIPFRDALDDDSSDVAPWESSGRDSFGGARRRQDSAADSGSSSSDVSSAVCERRRLPQQSTLDGGLRGAPPPLRRLSAVEPRHLAPLASPPRDPRPRPPPAPAPAPTPAAPPHPTPTISVSSAPDDESGNEAPPDSPDEPRSLAVSDEPSSVFASADVTPTEPARTARRTLEERARAAEPSRPAERAESPREPSTIEETAPASSKSSKIGDLPEAPKSDGAESSPARTTVAPAPIAAPSATGSPASSVPASPASLVPSDQAAVQAAPVITATPASVAVPTAPAPAPTPPPAAAPPPVATPSPPPAPAPAPAQTATAQVPESAGARGCAAAAAPSPVAVAPLAVGEDLCCEDDHYDKVPSAPGRGAAPVPAPDPAPAADAAATNIAHDEPSAVSESNIVKRDNKSDLGDRKQRNDICPWEDDVIIAPKRRLRNTLENCSEIYSIIIKPKLYRSNSLSELTTNCSDSSFFRQPNSVSLQRYSSKSFFDQSGDAIVQYCSNTTSTSTPYTRMSWNYKGKTQKKRAKMCEDTYGSKFAAEFAQSNQVELADDSSHPEDSSVESLDPDNYNDKPPTFPFKSTPSGNLKVQSNQVVFQSSTVGVLLADPTQAKVKVKFEGKAGGEPDDDSDINDAPGKGTCHSECSGKPKLSGVKDEKGRDLESLGYAMFEPVDWLRVQLPKKQDLFQEFYRRVHNYINTDTVIHIGDEEFHCHQLVLQVYSAFFNSNTQKDIILPAARVTPQAFQTIYEWMIFSGPESNRALKRDNILSLFCAAQFLAIKDLEDQCWAFIVNESLINEDTAFALFREARANNITSVMDLMVPRVQRFFLPLVASRDFVSLELDETLTFLKSNYICVTSEIEILMAGVRWLYGDWPTRRRHAAEVMRCVRFGLISPWQLVDIKRNPDNGEILEVVNDPEVQQMVDDGLAYVIIKYWYGNNSKNYYHWIDVLGLTEPAERNWIGEEMNHVTYKDFLKYLEQFMVPKDQMYQQMAMMQPPRRSEDMPSLRGMDPDKIDMRRPKMDLPLPTTLKGFGGNKDSSFPTMSDFFMDRRKTQDRKPSPPRESSSSAHGAALAMQMKKMKNVLHERNVKLEGEAYRRCQQSKFHLPVHRPQVHQVQMCMLEQETETQQERQVFDPPEKDSVEEINTNQSESSDEDSEQMPAHSRDERRPSAAASYLAAATAAMTSGRSQPEAPTSRAHKNSATPQTSTLMSRQLNGSPTISLFNQSKESLARVNMNKLSTSILGPTNKVYNTEGSLFNWSRETVLVFGGIDPHAPYGVGRNTGKDIFRFDPVTNTWDNVGELPEPRHHHSVAFLRGRVYLVGGSDPRDDDTRGKSVVVSTAWSFEPVSRAWFSESGLSVPRKNFGLVVHRMALYAIGGQDKKGRVLRSVEKFDPKNGSWSEVRSMSVARMAVAATKYREYIWVAGGMTGEKKRPVCKVVECYNSETNEWTEIYNLRFPRCFSTLFSMNDKLYLVGGAGKMSEKEKTASSVGAIDYWDWKSRSWKQQTEMSIPRHGHALAYLGTQIIIIGGVTTIYMRALNNVESFCCEREAWIRGVASMPSPLSGHGAVTLPPASLM